MGEVVNVLVAFAVIVFVVRWATSGASHHTAARPTTESGTGKEVDPNSPAALLGFKPKNVSPEQARIPPSNAILTVLTLRTGRDDT